MTLLRRGLKAMELIASEGMRSVVVVQMGVAAVKSAVCQMPPLTVAANRCLAFIGSTAMALTAPTFRLAEPSAAGPMTLPPCATVPPSVIGAGPSALQFGTPGKLTDHKVRSSRR